MAGSSTSARLSVSSSSLFLPPMPGVRGAGLLLLRRMFRTGCAGTSAGLDRLSGAGGVFRVANGRRRDSKLVEGAALGGVENEEKEGRPPVWRKRPTALFEKRDETIEEEDEPAAERESSRGLDGLDAKVLVVGLLGWHATDMSEAASAERGGASEATRETSNPRTAAAFAGTSMRDGGNGEPGNKFEKGNEVLRGGGSTLKGAGKTSCGSAWADSPRAPAFVAAARSGCARDGYTGDNTPPWL